MAGSRRRFWMIGGVVAVACLFLAWGGIAWTSTTDFCLSCHEMRAYQREMALSPHAKDADGNEIGCSQCHIPNSNVIRMVSAKAWLGLRDVWVHNVDGGDDLDRAAMQKVARRFTDDANCRKCHMDMNLNASGKCPISEEGRLSHANYLGQNGQARSGCVGCHVNMAHLPAFDERIPANREFALKIKEIRS